MACLSTVLVVDDEKICLTIAKKLVEHLEMDAICTDDGEKAVELYKKNQKNILCVLLDIQMPGMNGIETFERLQEIDGKVQVIIVSGFVNAKNKMLIDPLHPVGYLEKPIDLESVQRMLHKLPHTYRQ